MKTWITKQGEEIEVSSMDTSHIENCIIMLRSQVVDPYDVHGYDPQMGYGGFVDGCINEDNERIEGKIKAFEDELSSRNK